MSVFATSLLARATPADVVADPFPHLTIKPVFDDATYQALAGRFPPTDAILHGRDAGRSNSAARLPFFLAARNPAVDDRWKAFFAYHVSQDFWRDIVAVFGDAIRKRHPGIEDRVGRPLEGWRVAPRSETVKIGAEIDVELDCQFVVNTPVQEVSAVRTAHVDGETTLFSGLFYLRAPEDTVPGGDLELGRWRRRTPRFLPGRMILPHDIDIVRRISYEANSFACFINGAGSIHGVTPRGITPLYRRYINLIAKVGFDLFETPPVGAVARYWHGREIGGIDDRHLRGDRRDSAARRTPVE